LIKATDLANGATAAKQEKEGGNLIVNLSSLLNKNLSSLGDSKKSVND
jgi:hypothetical protein